ncbi:hypothetical protein AAZX31_13G049900 [Glycine max]
MDQGQGVPTPKYFMIYSLRRWYFVTHTHVYLVLVFVEEQGKGEREERGMYI